MSVRPTPVMISCEQRRHTERPRTLAQLAAVGIRPYVVESPCNPASDALNRLTAFRAIEHAEYDPYGCLFLEDDIDVNPRLFKLFLEIAMMHQQPVTFTCFRRSLHPPGVLERLEAGQWGQPALVQMVNFKERRGFYGTQCFYLPPWLVAKVLANPDDFMQPDGSPLEHATGFDFWLKEKLESIYIAIPNPVQHRNPPKMNNVTRGINAVPSPVHTSLTFKYGVDG